MQTGFFTLFYPHAKFGEDSRTWVDISQKSIYIKHELTRYKYSSSDHFDISFKIVAQLDPKIFQFYEKIRSVAIETANPTVRRNFFVKFFIILVWLARYNFLGSSRTFGQKHIFDPDFGPVYYPPSFGHAR